MASCLNSTGFTAAQGSASGLDSGEVKYDDFMEASVEPEITESEVSFPAMFAVIESRVLVEWSVFMPLPLTMAGLSIAMVVVVVVADMLCSVNL